MRQLMWPQYERAGLPEALLFGIMAKESNGKVHASSRAGAAGPMQFMYATGKRFGLGPDGTGFDTRFDPRAAAEASAAYLNERMGELNRSIELALAAYNGGEGRALRVYQASGGRGFWDADGLQPVPAGNARLRADGDRRGVAVPASEAIRLEPSRRSTPGRRRCSWRKPASIYELTICLGNGGAREGYMRALRNLNPRYEADSWLPAGTTLNATTKIVGLYGRHCTQGPRADTRRTSWCAAIRARRSCARARSTMLPMTDARAAAVPTDRRHRQARAGAGEDPQLQRAARRNADAISQKFQCDTRELAKANDIKPPRYAIRPGAALAAGRMSRIAELGCARRSHRFRARGYAAVR